MSNKCSNLKKIAIIGAGSWGTALAILLTVNVEQVCLWGHRKDSVDSLLQDRENKKYLPGRLFPSKLQITNNLKYAVQDSGLLIMAVPSHGYRKVFNDIMRYLNHDCRIISAVKGIENDSLMTMTQIMDDVLVKHTRKNIIQCGVLSGPSFAEEVTKKIPTAVTIGFEDLNIAKQIQSVFVTDYFRVYASSDVIGLEISACLKNIIAIATGICDGLGYGLNTRAALITRGLAEIQRLGIALGADSHTFSGLSGMGDLILTCTGDLSRNRQVGLMLGKGKKIKQIEKEMNMVAEGIKTTKSAFDLANKMKIEMPILEQIYCILYKNKEVAVAAKDLLNRELKVE